MGVVLIYSPSRDKGSSATKDPISRGGGELRGQHSGSQEGSELGESHVEL